MEFEQYTNHLEIAKDAFIWRYTNFPKLYDLLSSNQIYFTRLDVFDDPLEGLQLSIRSKLHLRNLTKLESNEAELRQMTDLPQFDITSEQVEAWQQGIFASCWYLTENSYNHHESLAMWQLYCDKYSFAIKISFTPFLECLKDTLKNYIDKEIIAANYGKIDYLSLHEDFEKSYTKEPMPALIKDKSFKHENEIRFLLLRANRTKGEYDRNAIKIKLKKSLLDIDDKIEILCHPDMDISVFNTFRAKIQDLGFNIKYSTLLTRNVVSSLIKRKE